MRSASASTARSVFATLFATLLPSTLRKLSGASDRCTVSSRSAEARRAAEDRLLQDIVHQEFGGAVAVQDFSALTALYKKITDLVVLRCKIPTLSGAASWARAGTPRGGQPLDAAD